MKKATEMLARNACRRERPAWVFPKLQGSLHFHEASQNLAWYQQRVSSGGGVFGAGLRCRQVRKEFRCRNLGLSWVSDVIRSARRATSSHNRVTSEFVCWVEIEATVGVTTSMTLSAMSASLHRSKEVSADASTIRTLGGNLCKNSS